MHRYRMLAGAVALAAASQGPAQQVETCRKTGFETISLARTNGFQFFRIDSNASECEIENATIVVSAPQDRDGRCRFRLFSGQPLNPGWTISRIVVEYSPPAARAEVGPASPMGRVLTLTVPKGRTGLFTIRRVNLKGRDCGRWRDAFE